MTMPIDASQIGALDAIYRRRATRAFTPQPVDDAAIRELLRAAVHAPTAMHLEPWAFELAEGEPRGPDHAGARGGRGPRVACECFS
jgi:nitroreductase family protein